MPEINQSPIISEYTLAVLLLLGRINSSCAQMCMIEHAPSTASARFVDDASINQILREATSQRTNSELSSVLLVSFHIADLSEGCHGLALS